MSEHPLLSLSIDGRTVTGHATETILAVARRHGIALPTLCDYEGLSPVGSCRLCAVEIEGRPKISTACTTAIEEGMQVATQSPRLHAHRRAIIELLLSERTHVCAVCVANGRCELQNLAQEFGVDHVRYPGLAPSYALDASHDRFVLDPNRCILCSRCLRVCAEIEGAHSWDVKNRGIRSQTIIDADLPWGQSTTCTGCGKCVLVCPTGALFAKEGPLRISEPQPLDVKRLLLQRQEGRQ
jgi:bidirectional [NiFe] hydrogenase diaphorase subunit